MSRLSKTASAAIAALVVSGAAAVAPFLGPSATGGQAAASSGGASPSGGGAAAAGTSAASGAARAAGAPDQASGLPRTATTRAPAAARGVLFIGTSPALNPRGGSRSSFACGAAKLLDRHCAVAARVPSAASAAKLQADVVVLVMAPTDDARALTAELDALPASLRGGRTAILAPVAVTRARTTATNLPAVRALAAARGADLVDPVDLHWLTAATRATYLAADGVQPTAAGVTYLGERLAAALAAAGA